MIIFKVIAILFFINLIKSQEISCNNEECKNSCKNTFNSEGNCNKFNFCVCNDYPDRSKLKSIVYYNNDKIPTDIYAGERNNLGFCKLFDFNIKKVNFTELGYKCYEYSTSNIVCSIPKGQETESDCSNFKDRCINVYGGFWNINNNNPDLLCPNCLENNQVLKKSYGNIGCCKSNGLMTYDGKEKKCFIASGNTWMCYGDTDCKGKCSNPNKSCFCDGGECHN